MRTIKKFMYLNRTAPHGSIYAQEGLEVALIGAAFAQDVSMAFVDDGVLQLKRGQDPTAGGMKNFSLSYKALGDYAITKLYVERESLAIRGLNLDDLMPISYEDAADNDHKKPSIRLVSSAELSQIIAAQDIILNY